MRGICTKIIGLLFQKVADKIIYYLKPRLFKIFCNKFSHLK